MLMTEALTCQGCTVARHPSPVRAPGLCGSRECGGNRSCADGLGRAGARGTGGRPRMLTALSRALDQLRKTEVNSATQQRPSQANKNLLCAGNQRCCFYTPGSHAREGAQATLALQTPPLALSLLDPRCPHTLFQDYRQQGGARASSRAPSDDRRVGRINYGHSKPQITPCAPCHYPRPPVNVPGGRAKSGAALLPSRPPNTVAIPEVLFQTRGLPHLPPALPALPAPTASIPPKWAGRGRAPWRHSPPRPTPTPTPGKQLSPGCLQQGQGPPCRLWRGRKRGFDPHPAAGTEQVTPAHSPTLKNGGPAPPRQGTQARPPPGAGPRRLANPGPPGQDPHPAKARLRPVPQPLARRPVATRLFPAPPRGRARPGGCGAAGSLGMDAQGEATGLAAARGVANTCGLRAQNPRPGSAHRGRPGASAQDPGAAGTVPGRRPPPQSPGHRHGSPRLVCGGPASLPVPAPPAPAATPAPPRAEERAFGPHRAATGRALGRGHQPARQSDVPGARGQGGGCAPGPGSERPGSRSWGAPLGDAPRLQVQLPRPRCAATRSGKRAPRDPHSPALIPAAAPRRPCRCGARRRDDPPPAGQRLRAQRRLPAASPQTPGAPAPPRRLRPVGPAPGWSRPVPPHPRRAAGGAHPGKCRRRAPIIPPSHPSCRTDGLQVPAGRAPGACAGRRRRCGLLQPLAGLCGAVTVAWLSA